MTESAGNPQDLLSDPSPTFSEEDDDGIGDEPIDEVDEIEPVAIEKATPPVRRSREGLPPGFRMRNDAHYVDELTAAPAIRQIAVGEIDRDPDAGGSEFPLDALIESIRRAGVLQPLLVASRRGRFLLIDGGRRLAAATVVGLRHVPCIVHEVDEPSAQQMRRSVNVRQPVPHVAEPVHAIPSLAVADLARRLDRTRAQAAAGGIAPSRGAADVLQMELARAARIAHATAIMLETPRLRRRELSAQAFAEQIVAATATERRLTGVRLTTVVDDPDFQVPADPTLIVQALAGAIDVLTALVEDSGLIDGDRWSSDAAGSSTLTLTTHCVKTRPAMIVELAQAAVSVEPDLMSQFFDLNSSVHPGGPSSALLLAAAARVVRAHGGRVDARRDDPVGCTITFVLPQSAPRLES